jgi:hypothetical protein
MLNKVETIFYLNLISWSVSLKQERAKDFKQTHFFRKLMPKKTKLTRRVTVDAICVAGNVRLERLDRLQVHHAGARAAPGLGNLVTLKFRLG